MLPDLHALQANLSGWTVNSLGGNARELRYATAMANGGQGAFELRGTNTFITGVDGVQRQLVNQRIYLSEGGFEDRPAGYFVYHPTHGHIHFEDMAFGILRQRLPGNVPGDIVALGPKTSFALIDINHYNPSLPGSPASAQYGGGNIQGISVGWNDVYGSGLDGQQINITGVANGDYFLEVTVDPLNHIAENNETNNTTRIPITLSNLPPAGFRIFQATPIGAQSTPVSFAEFDFSQAVNPATFTTSDVVFNGPGGPITPTSIEAVTSTKFRVHFATQGTIGTYTMNVGPDIRTTTGQMMDTNNNGVGGEPGDVFNLIFTVTAPRVLNTTPAPGAVSPPFNTVRVTFNKPMQSATFTTADIASFTGPGGVNLAGSITGIVPTATGGLSSSFDINFASQTTIGAYTLVIEPNILDENGNPIDNNGDGLSNQNDRFTGVYNITPVGVSGPDAFGYTGQTTPVQSLTLVAGQTGVTTLSFTDNDDGATAFNLGTNRFNFYGTQYTGNNQLFVSVNGLVSFGGTYTEWQNGDLSGVTRPAIAALWDDWIINAGGSVLAKFFDDNGDTVNDRLVIQWTNIQHHPSSQGGTFQLVMQVNTGNTPGKILFNYPDLIFGDGNDGGASATVGQRSPTGTVLQISLNGSNNLVGNNKAINVSVPTLQSMAQMDPNPAPTGDLEYLVTFSTPVTGVDIADFTVTATGGSVGTYIDHIHATADPAVYEVHLKTPYANGTVRLDLIDNGTILSNLGAQLGGTGNGNGNFTTGPVYNVVQPAPQVQGINVGDGTQQRSQLKLLQVVFDYPVQFAGGNGNAAAAFELTGPNGPVTVSVDLSTSTPNQTVARLTFSGANTEFGSLKDGVYTLRVLSSMISTGGVALDGDGNGTPGGDRTLQVHRLYGDVNGDGTVNAFDLGQFRNAFGSSLGDPNYRDYLDFDGDGVISGTINSFDYGMFRDRFGINLFP